MLHVFYGDHTISLPLVPLGDVMGTALSLGEEDWEDRQVQNTMEGGANSMNSMTHLHKENTTPG